MVVYVIIFDWRALFYFATVCQSGCGVHYRYERCSERLISMVINPNIKVEAPSTSCHGWTTSNHRRTPLWTGLRGKKTLQSNKLTPSIRKPSLFFFLRSPYWMIFVPSSILIEKDCKPVFFMSFTFSTWFSLPLRYEGKGAWANCTSIAFCSKVVMDGHSALCTLLTRGCLYFSPAACINSHLCKDSQECCFHSAQQGWVAVFD